MASQETGVRHGLKRASFVSSPEVRVLRELIRHRKAMVDNMTSERNRTLQLLESANVKLASVIGGVFGMSGMLMLRALAEDCAAAVEMADLSKRRFRRKVDQLALTLDGCLAEHDCLLLGLHIRRLSEIDRGLTEIEATIGAAMRRFAPQQACLATIPGVDEPTATSTTPRSASTCQHSGPRPA